MFCSLLFVFRCWLRRVRLNKKLDPMEHGVLVNNGLCLPMILVDFGMLVFLGMIVCAHKCLVI